MNRPAAALKLSDAQRDTLDVLARSTSASHQQVQRARVLRLAAAGEANTRIAERVGVTVVTVRAWRARFEQAGLADLGVVRAGRGRKPSIPDAKAEAIVHATLHDKPLGETHWSCRSMAKAQGSARRRCSGSGLREDSSLIS